MDSDHVDISDVSSADLPSHVRSILSRTVVDLPFEMRSGADVLIEEARASFAADPNFRPRLETAMRSLMRELGPLLADPDSDAVEVRSAGRLAFAATELGMTLDPENLRKIAETSMPTMAGRPEFHGDYLLVLRALARQEAGAQDVGIWNRLLEFPNKGIRTMAAQFVVKAGPEAAVARLDDFVSKDVNAGLVAHQFVRMAGGPERLADMLDRVAAGPAKRAMLADMLIEAGEDVAAHLIVGINSNPTSA